jgi:hypothetical protein
VTTPALPVPVPADDVSAVATAVGDGVVAATPVIAQQVSQAYENAFKSRIASIQSALDALQAKPGDPDARAAFDALFTRLCSDAGFVRTPGGVGANESVDLGDLAILLNGLPLIVELKEQLAAAVAK